MKTVWASAAPSASPTPRHRSDFGAGREPALDDEDHAAERQAERRRPDRIERLVAAGDLDGRDHRRVGVERAHRNHWFGNRQRPDDPPRAHPNRVRPRRDSGDRADRRSSSALDAALIGR
jgi:hypothetical protein